MSGEDWPEEWVVVEAAASCVVDQTADEVELRDAAVEFFDGFCGVEGGQHREASEASW